MARKTNTKEKAKGQEQSSSSGKGIPSGFVGVSFYKRTGLWGANLWVNKLQLGEGQDEERVKDKQKTLDNDEMELLINNCVFYEHEISKVDEFLELIIAGSYFSAVDAARAYDKCLIKSGRDLEKINFPLQEYMQDIDEMKDMNFEGYIKFVRKGSKISKCEPMGDSVKRTLRDERGVWEVKYLSKTQKKRKSYTFGGYFDNEEGAVEAYNKLAIEDGGEQVVEKFPRPGGGKKGWSNQIKRPTERLVLGQDHPSKMDHDDDVPSTIIVERTKGKEVLGNEVGTTFQMPISGTSSQLHGVGSTSQVPITDTSSQLQVIGSTSQLPKTTRSASRKRVGQFTPVARATRSRVRVGGSSFERPWGGTTSELPMATSAKSSVGPVGIEQVASITSEVLGSGSPPQVQVGGDDGKNNESGVPEVGVRLDHHPTPQSNEDQNANPWSKLSDFAAMVTNEENLAIVHFFPGRS